MIKFNVGSSSTSISVKVGFMVLLSLLACIEKPMSIMNTVSVERDWVVVIAGSNNSDLREMNSIMRRIDLFCKMVGPLSVSFLVGYTYIGTAWLLAIFNFGSVFIEYFSIAKVYFLVPALAVRASASEAQSENDEQETSLLSSDTTPEPSTVTQRTGLSAYIHHSLFLPSFALSCLYWNVLTFGGLFVTYMLALGYSPAIIGVLRTVSVTFELAATWISPLLMSRVGPVRAGLWCINWEALCITGAVIAIYSTNGNSSTDKFLFIFSSKSTFLLVSAVIFSRLGLWGFDLCAQSLIQEGVEPESRTTFSSFESSFQNSFELLSFASTIIFDKADNFWIPSAMSAIAVLLGAGCMALFTFKVRKHLIHGIPISRLLHAFKSRDVNIREMVIQQELDEEV